MCHTNYQQINLIWEQLFQTGNNTAADVKVHFTAFSNVNYHEIIYSSWYNHEII